MATPSVSAWRSSTQLSILPYLAMIPSKISPALLFQAGTSSGSWCLTSLAHIMGTSVSETTAEIRIVTRSEEHTSELQSLRHLVCRLLLEKKKKVHPRGVEDHTHGRQSVRHIVCRLP